ncbi:MAG: hypothetical protein VX665_06780, partial [Pseudomonadota bacterium]|nr:hypothetical protein [Pseudomonadota bacterium]
YGLAVVVLHALDIDFDLVADNDVGLLTRGFHLLKRNAPHGFKADIDDHGVAFKADDEAANDTSFDVGMLAEAFGKKISKILCCSVCCGGGFGCQRYLRFTPWPAPHLRTHRL